MAALGRRGVLVGGMAVGLGLVLPSLSRAVGRTPRLERILIRVPGLDSAHDGLRLVQLSDLHAGHRTPDQLIRAAVDQANALSPDAVMLTGDYVCQDRREIGLARELMGGLRAPTFALLGNHDLYTDPRGMAAALRSLGYEVLGNAWTRIRLRGAPLTMVGVGDGMTGREDVARAVDGLAGTGAPVVLAHGPRTADRLRRLGRPLLCLSGHTHGGQISLPLLTPMVFSRVAGEHYVRGRYRLDGVQLYVNRGIGNSGVRVRINSPPEVTLVTLRAA